jgi:hypothetical protein
MNKEELFYALETKNFNIIRYFLQRNILLDVFDDHTGSIIIPYIIDFDYIIENLEDQLIYDGAGRYYTYNELKSQPIKILKPIAEYYEINIKNMRKKEIIRDIIIAEFLKIVHESQIQDD